METLIVVIGMCWVLLVFPLVLKNYNNKKSNKKVEDLQTKFSLNFNKIIDKNCSIKRLGKIDFVDRNLIFQKCNLLIEEDFIVIQGITTIPFKSIIRNFILTEFPEKISDYSNWEIIQPIHVELINSQTQIKIVFRPNISVSGSNYSLIISDLTSEEFKMIEKLKNYC